MSAGDRTPVMNSPTPGRGGNIGFLRSVTTPPRELLHVFPSFNVGGPQVRFAALAGGLGDRFRHTVLSLSGRYDAAELLPPRADVQLYGAPPAEGGGMFARLRAYHALLGRNPPDVLVTYNWGTTEVAMANLLRGIPHLHLEDGFGPDEQQRQFRRRIWGRRLILSRSQVVVPSTTLEQIATRCWRLAPCAVHYIPNGIAPKLHPARPLHDLGVDLPDGLPRVVWTAALRREKNPLRMLRAFAPIKDRAVLLIIGSGPEHEDILREAERLRLGPNLRLLGGRADARDIMMHCDVAALSSDTEQMPIAVLEAMDAGLPMAACDVGDVRRMLAPDNRPFVTPPADESLGRSLAALVDNAELRARVGQANRRKLRTTYTLGPMIDAYAALLDRMAAGNGARARSLRKRHVCVAESDGVSERRPRTEQRNSA